MNTDDEYGSDSPLSNLHSLLLGGPTVEDFLVQLARLAARVVEPPASCGITTRYGTRPHSIATSDERAALIDEQQYGNGDGPCLESLRTGRVVEVQDQRTDDRWGVYGEHAVRLGVLCSLSFPLVVEDRTTGAMNLYGYDRPNTFSEDDKQRAEVFAAQASTALTLALRFAQHNEVTEQLEAALESRTVIDQAIGVLMAQQRCDADTAFDLLRKHSQNNNRKLRDVAAGLIFQVTGRPPVQGKTFQRVLGDDDSLSGPPRA